MSDVLWWREESWWERRSLPLFGFILAPRQLVALCSTGLLGFFFSNLLRDSLPGRIGVFLFFLSIGFVFATKRVKMTPVELQLYYRFVRRQGFLKSATQVPHIVWGTLGRRKRMLEARTKSGFVDWTWIPR